MRRTDPVACSIGLLAAANVLNNRIARRWAPLTSAVTTAALIGLARGEGLSLRELGIGAEDLGSRGRGARLGGALAAGVAAVYTAGVALPRTRPLFLDDRALALSHGRLAEEILLQVPVGTVLLEEVAFRGVLPALLTSCGIAGRPLSSPAAAAASAALFGLWHVLPAIDMACANPALGRVASAEPPAAPGTAPRGAVRLVAGTVVSTAVAGSLFHELCRRGGLIAPSLLHLAMNSLGYVAARLARRIEERTDKLSERNERQRGLPPGLA
ncbi:CPBP family glutamic-type intramembrane protease [Sphaerimonospora sp. CA-214678]|uniref:CPBP family glutamic-type intramembrane protease n=1 Tax=Sphaerimonospora sp. CA-214678 TaxID=3240029 RepID=UPI003D92F641